MATNVAPTRVASLIETLHVPVPLHAPSQPVKFDPVLAAAVSVTALPDACVITRSQAQVIPVGVLVTVPARGPLVVTISAGSAAGAGVAALDAADSSPIPEPMPLLPRTGSPPFQRSV